MKPIFPDTNPCGRLFNDYLSEKPVMDLCTAMGKVAYTDKWMLVIELPDTADRIHITHRNGAIGCVEYETVSDHIIGEMTAFLNANFRKQPIDGMSRLDVYEVRSRQVYATVLCMAGTYYIGLRRM